MDTFQIVSRNNALEGRGIGKSNLLHRLTICFTDRNKFVGLNSDAINRKVTEYEKVSGNEYSNNNKYQ